MRRPFRIRIIVPFIALLALLPGGISALRAEPLHALGKKMASAAKDLKNRKIAVLPFPYYDGRSSIASGAVSERIVAGALASEKVTVVDRARTEGFMREIAWQSMGAIDQTVIRQAGRVLGVEAALTGILIPIDDRHVEVVAHLVLTETGQVLERDSVEVKQFWKDASVLPRTDAGAKESAPEAASVPVASGAAAEQEAAEAQAAADAQAAAIRAAEMAAENQPEAVQEPAQTPVADPARARLHDQIILDTRGEGGLTAADYDLLASNWPLSVKSAGENSQLFEGYRILKAGDAARALGIFTLLERRFRKQPALRAVAQLGLSLCQFQQGRKSDAASLASSVAGQADFPAISAAGSYVLGRYAENFGRHKKARAHFLDAIRATPFQTPLVKASADRVKRLEAVFSGS